MTARSLWEIERPGHVPQSRPAPGSVYDDVVLGGGAVGLSVATELAHRGRRVVVVEARPVIGGGTSGRSTGKLSLLQGTRLSTIERHHGTSASAAYVQTCQEALAWIEQVLERWEVPFQRRPAVSWAAHEREIKATRAEDAAARRAGLATRWQRAVPGGLPGYGAVVLEDQLQVDPLAYTAALAQEAVDAGVDVQVGRRARSVGGGEHPVVALDDGTELTAEQVVVATGLPVLDRSAAFATTKPHRSYIVAFESDQELEPMAVSVGSPSWTVRGATDADGRPLVLVGGHGHAVGRSMPAGRHVEALRGWAGEHLDVGREVAAWSAQDYQTPDEVPIVGRTRGSSRVHVITGFGGWGLVAGVGAARRLARAVAEGDEVPVVPPRRLLGARAAAAVLGWNSEVGAHMTSGWLGALGRATVTPGETQGVVTRGRPPVATSVVDGCTRSVSAVCPHLGGIVRWNDVEGSWDCPLHGSRFEADGRLIEGPATRGLAPVRPDADESTT